MRLLVFDNYDSFTYNLVHLAEKLLGCKVDVCKNDQITLEKLREYDRIILSPGPGLPSDAGLLLELISDLATSIPILGVCLGHQAIAESFGGKLKNLDRVFHGVATKIRITDRENPLFKGMEEEMVVGRYHSWVVDPASLPACLKVTAVDADGNIMAMQHREYPLCSVQFHPESVLTPLGEKILSNWISTKWEGF